MPSINVLSDILSVSSNSIFNEMDASIKIISQPMIFLTEAVMTFCITLLLPLASYSLGKYNHSLKHSNDNFGLFGISFRWMESDLSNPSQGCGTSTNPTKTIKISPPPFSTSLLCYPIKARDTRGSFPGLCSLFFQKGMHAMHSPYTKFVFCFQIFKGLKCLWDIK